MSCFHILPFSLLWPVDFLGNPIMFYFLPVVLSDCFALGNSNCWYCYSILLLLDCFCCCSSDVTCYPIARAIVSKTYMYVIKYPHWTDEGQPFWPNSDSEVYKNKMPGMDIVAFWGLLLPWQVLGYCFASTRSSLLPSPGMYNLFLGCSCSVWFLISIVAWSTLASRPQFDVWCFSYKLCNSIAK